MIEIKLEGPSGSFSIAGAVFREEDARITMIDGYDMEIKTVGRTMLYRNQDRPGMLARVGSLLADHEINIGSLSLGRKSPGEEALTAMAVDQTISEEIIKLVANIEGVHRVRMLEFLP